MQQVRGDGLRWSQGCSRAGSGALWWGLSTEDDCATAIRQEVWAGKKMFGVLEAVGTMVWSHLQWSGGLAEETPFSLSMHITQSNHREPAVFTLLCNPAVYLLPSPASVSDCSISHALSPRLSCVVLCVCTCVCLCVLRPRGFGFIEFRDPRDAEEALYKLDRTMFMGREISVRTAVPGSC